MIFLSSLSNTKRIFAIATAVYGLLALITFGSLSQHLFELDDLAYLQDLRQIRQNPNAIFSPDRQLPGRPVTDIALLLIQITNPNDPAAFHIALVLCHVITTLLLTLTFYKTGLNQELSLIAGLFFLINLAHFRAIHWISCFAYPLALGFGCVGILAYLAYQSSLHKKWYGLSLCGFLLAILSHPAAIVFPTFLFYTSWQKKQPLKPILVMGALAFIFLFGLLSRFPQVPQAEHATAIHQWSLIDLIRHGFWYLGRLWTSTFFVFPEMNTVHTFDLIFGILALISGIALWYYNIFPTAHWGVWMLLGIAMFMTNPNQTHFESGPSRHLYFASAGSAVILAWGCQKLCFKLSRLTSSYQLPKICLTLLIILITSLSIVGLKKAETFTYVLSARTYLGNKQKETATHLFERAVIKAPELITSSMYERFIIVNLADGHFLIHILHQGLAHYPKSDLLIALRMIYGFQSDTVNHQHLTNRVVTFAQQSNEEVKKMVAIACLYLGYFYNTNNQKQPAQILFHAALMLRPGYPDAAIYLSQIYMDQNKVDEARKILHSATELHPTHVEALQSLADLYRKEKNWTQVENLFQNALTQQPNAIDLKFKLGYTYMYQKKYVKARPLFEALTQQAPKSWQAFAYLGQCLQAIGNGNEAIRAYQRALQLNPDQPELHILLKQLAAPN